MLRRARLVAAAAMLLAVAFHVGASPAHAQDDWEKDQGTITRGSEDLETDDSWHEGERGGTGENGHWYTTEADAHAFWHFGELHGKFRVEHFYVGQDAVKKDSCRRIWYWAWLRVRCTNAAPSELPRYTIQQPGSGDVWMTVAPSPYAPTSLKADGKFKEGWRGWWDQGELIELDGDIRVKVEKQTSSATSVLAAEAVRFVWVGPLTSEVERRETGNSVDGTLSQFYADRYAQYIETSDSSSEHHQIGGVPVPYRQLCYSPEPPVWSNAEYVKHVGWKTTRRPRGNDKELGVASTYHFPIGECTSWVQFRINQETGSDYFDNGYGHEAYGGTGEAWSDAERWDDQATKVGKRNPRVVVVSRADKAFIPRRGMVAQWNSLRGSPIGHVAFIEAVSDDGQSIWISEMNNGDRVVCYLTIRELTKPADGDDRRSLEWPDNFIAIG